MQASTDSRSIFVLLVKNVSEKPRTRIVNAILLVTTALKLIDRGGKTAFPKLKPRNFVCDASNRLLKLVKTKSVLSLLPWTNATDSIAAVIRRKCVGAKFQPKTPLNFKS